MSNYNAAGQPVFSEPRLITEDAAMWERRFRRLRHAVAMHECRRKSDAELYADAERLATERER